MLQKASMAFGIVFVAIGILGFVPALTPNGHLLGIFHVDAVHNIIHLASGVAALLAASSAAFSRLYFQIFGVVYAIVAVGGFLPPLQFGEEEKLLGLTHMNMADNFLHVAIAAAALYFGFAHKEDATAHEA
jgi:nitrate/nitrite transporter NarK